MLQAIHPSRIMYQWDNCGGGYGWIILQAIQSSRNGIMLQNILSSRSVYEWIML